MNKRQLLEKIKNLANIKNIDISKLNLSDKKEQLEKILNCLNISDFQMKLIFEKFTSVYPNIANEVKEKYLHNWLRFHIYETMLIEDKIKNA